MDKKVIAAVICVVVAGAALGAYFIATPAPQIEQKQSEITVTDLAGRQVSVVVPVERVVLARSRDMDGFVAVEGGKNPFKKIVGWGPDLRMWDKDAYDKYKEKFPEIENIPDVGSFYEGTFSVEKVIELKPDVVIFPLFARERVKEIIDKLEEAGIPSIFLEYGAEDPFEYPIKSTLLYGILLGKEDRAKEIVDFIREQNNKVFSRLEKIDKPKPKVYAEGGFKGPSEYGNTYGSNFDRGLMIRRVGGINIAEGIVERCGPINPEYLLKANPDVIIITGSYWPATPGSMRLGYYANPEESKELLKGYLKRSGWDTLNAVKNNRVYSDFHGFSFHIYNFAGLQALAKFLYPDEFKDLDPEETFKEFHEKFMPVEYSGVWMLSLEEEPRKQRI